MSLIKLYTRCLYTWQAACVSDVEICIYYIGSSQKGAHHTWTEWVQQTSQWEHTSVSLCSSEAGVEKASSLQVISCVSRALCHHTFAVHWKSPQIRLDWLSTTPIIAAVATKWWIKAVLQRTEKHKIDFTWISRQCGGIQSSDVLHKIGQTEMHICRHAIVKLQLMH